MVEQKCRDCPFYHAVHVKGLYRGYICLARSGEEPEGCPMVKPESREDLVTEVHRLRMELLRAQRRAERAERKIEDRARADREKFYVAVGGDEDHKLIKCWRCAQCGAINDARMSQCSRIHRA